MENINQEVDLFDLLNKIGSKIYHLFAALGRLTIEISQFLFKNAVILIIFIAVGFGVAYLYLQNVKPVYVTKFTARVNCLESADYKPYFNDLKEMMTQQETNLLAKELKLTLPEVNTIQTINCYAKVQRNKDDIYEKVLEHIEISDTSMKCMPDIRFEIVSYKNDSVMLKKISHHVINYLCAPKIVQTENENWHHRIKENIGVINEQARVIDSIQRKRNPTLNSLVVTDKKEEKVFKDVIKLTEQRQYLEKLLTLYSDPISLTDEVSFPQRINTPTSIIYKIITLFFGLGIIFSLAFRKIRENMKMKKNN
jgi:hypothetical protein